MRPAHPRALPLGYPANDGAVRTPETDVDPKQAQLHLNPTQADWAGEATGPLVRAQYHRQSLTSGWHPYLRIKGLSPS